ncbi:MAG: type II toxin-antitoxin system VapC family toxin [Sulfuricellaceae bacterium]|nr:type II toxin-antitoxin system VapC family toxin [Sulfuricellaceae bacterium]
MGSIIRPGATVYLDTNAIIYLTEGNPDFKARIEGLFVEIEQAGARLVTSELTYTEVLVVPFRIGNEELAAAYERLLDVLIEPIPLGRQELFLAAKLRANTPKLRTPDSLHRATAILAGSDVFVSGDAGIEVPVPMQKYIL